VFRKVDDFLQMWEPECQAMKNLLGTLTDSSLSHSAAPDDRTIGRVAWHITAEPYEMARMAGLPLLGPNSDSPVPATAKEIKEHYDAMSKALADAVRANWKDDSLLVVDDMFGGMYKWPRGVTLMMMIVHQAHHRGQVATLLRNAGIVPTPIYGPTREAWAGMGMPAPAV